MTSTPMLERRNRPGRWTPGLARRFAPLGAVTVDTLVRIAPALGVDVPELFPKP